MEIVINPSWPPELVLVNHLLFYLPVLLEIIVFCLILVSLV